MENNSMEPKKISFGFSKINKKLNIFANKESVKSETKVELIKCLEGQEIKLVEEKPEEQPLIIPLKESQKTSAALASLIKRRAVLLGEEELDQSSVPQNNATVEEPLSNTNEPEDIEKRAARELLADLQTNGSSDPSTNLILPVVKADDLPLEGAKESSLDDYESIPIQDYGKAMLRGMGWTEPAKIATKGGPPIDETPMVRPKGMGLGADKALKTKPLLVAPESNEVLEIKRNAYVRILGGKHKDLYGQIEGFDDHAGRVIVKMAIGGAKEAFNEFLCQPISRKEFAQYGKCINTTKYEEYKKKENEFGQIILKKEEIEEIDKSTKNERKIKTQRRDTSDDQGNDYKYQRNRDDYKDDRKEEKYKDKEFKREKEIDSNRSQKRDNERDRNREGTRNNESDRSREQDNNVGRERGSDEGRVRDRDTHRDEEKYRKRYKDRAYENDRRTDKVRDDGHDRYTSKYDEKNQRSLSKKDNRDIPRERDRDTYRDDCDKDSYKDTKVDQRSRDRDSYAQRKQRDDSPGSESESHTSKPKKSSQKDKKSKKKSKKSKKNKSKNKHDTSDSEISSSDSSSDSEEERRRKHKKKTKKSKKQRERSRSRGRR